MASVIALYPKISETKKHEKIPVDIFLDYIKDGKWQDYVLPIRALKDKSARQDAKKKVPYVTLSGEFSDRTDKGLVSHSGFIGIDIDDIDPEDAKGYLCPDKYVFAAFTSISGRGLCLVFKINGDKHREAFAGISEYLFENYKLICDPTSVNPSRARFVSYDPHLYLNPTCEKFTLYPKNKAPKKIDKIVFAQNDFEELVKQVQQRGLNICDNYHEWLRIGFAFADKFGESGRSYFHTVSAASQKYKPNDTDRQYNNCLKSRGSKLSTISTFYYYCKQAGLQLYSSETKQIINAAVSAKKGGRNPEQAAQNLSKFEQIPVQSSEDIIKQVFDNDVSVSNEDGDIQQLEQWLKHEYEIRKNEISRNFENRGKVMDQSTFNSIYIAAKKIFPKIGFEIIERIINSDFTPTYNPLKEFIANNEHRNPKGKIDKVFDCILSEDYNYTRKFGKKWFVGLIASIYGQHSPLMLILSGKVHGTGKTEFFRRMLPNELKSYIADVAAGIKDTDLNILMTQKLILLDDECGGKSKKDEIALKSMLSKQIFSLREPYGRNNVDLQRLAVLCGTTNDEGILSDPTGNRRIIPIPVYSINHEDYNAIDKADLFMEAYHLWKGGFNWQLTSEDIKELSDKTTRFENFSVEYELIMKWYDMPNGGTGFSYLTATDVKVEMEGKTHQKLSLDRIGKELQRLGYKQVSKKINGMPKKTYEISRRDGI
jgi:predicted P-loop ATPase